MADTLTFSLVSPERELFTGDVVSVLVPGEEGLFEVQADHAPVMATLSPGMLEIRDGAGTRKVYVKGGFADVTAAGLTVLAEFAVDADELTGEVLAAERAAAEAVVNDAASAPDDVLNARRALDVLSAA